MAFSTNEKVAAADKLGLQITGTGNAPPGEKFWYNEQFAWQPIVSPTKIWVDMAAVLPALTPLVADANVIAQPTLLEKRTTRLTLEPTSNNRAFLCRSIFGNNTSPMVEDWIQPSLIRNAGEPSYGYAIRLYDGDPGAGGTELPTTYLPGAGGAPSWAFNYSAGMLFVSTDQAASYAAIYAGAGLWAVGYRYVGPTAGAGGVTLTTYNLVADTEAAAALDNGLVYVVETNTIYRFEDTAGAFTRDGIYVLNTSTGGATRWLGVAGQYHIYNLATLGLVEFSAQPSDPSPPLLPGVRAYSKEAPGNDANTVFLCHFDNTGAPTTFIDSAIGGAAPHAITSQNFCAQQGLTNKFGSGSVAPDGISQYLSIANSPDFDLSATDFTLDCWVQPGVLGASQAIWTHGDLTDGLIVTLSAAGLPTFEVIVGGITVFSLAALTAVNTGEWTHIALVRSAGTYTWYMGGKNEGTAPYAPALATFVSDPEIGATAGIGQFYGGFIDEIRLSTTTRYTDEFEVASYAFGVMAPYWILPDGSIVTIKDLGVIGTKQWGEDGLGNLYRASGRVEVHEELGSSKETVRVTNNTGAPIIAWRVMKAVGFDATREIPFVSLVNGASQVPIGYTILPILDTEQAFIMKRGIITVPGFDTTISTIGNKVYADNITGALSLTDSGMPVGQVVDLAVNGTIYLNIGAGGGSGAVGSLTVLDEGILVNAGAAELNFIGAQIMAEQHPTLPARVNIYVPPPAYASHYNTVDGSTTGTVADTATSSRNVADPAPGLAYSIGAWVAGTAHLCTRTATLTFSTAGDISFADDSTTFFRCYVYTADDITPIASFTTGPIIGNTDTTASNIRVRVTGWAAEFSKFRGLVTIDFYLSLILPPGGRFSIKVEHVDGSDGTFTKTQGPMFYDVEPLAQAISNLTIVENTVSSSMYLSGIRYYDLGDTFDIAIADLDNMNANSYPTNFVELSTAGEYGIGNFFLAGVDLTGWATAWNNQNALYSNTKAITAASFRYIGIAANISARPIDWTNGGWINSADDSICVDTWAAESTDLAEYFTDEGYRRTSVDVVWDSTQDMTAYNDNMGLMIQNGLLQTRRTDWNSYDPGGGANPDYTGFVGWGTYYRRFIDAASLVRGSCWMAIAGFTLADLVAGDVRMWIMIPGRFVTPCYVHGPATYDFGTFDGDNDPIRVADSTPGNIHISFGNLGLQPGNNYFIMHIEITNPAINPSSIVVSW